MKQPFGRWLANKLANHPSEFEIDGQELRKEPLVATAAVLPEPAEQTDLPTMFATFTLCRLLGYDDAIQASQYWFEESCTPKT